jgi:hypothetical protein
METPARATYALPESSGGSAFRRAARLAAPVGACAYVLSFAIPTRVDYSLLLLAACAALAMFASEEGAPTRRINPLVIAILCFCAATAMSLFASINVARSFIVSTALLPALLLFVVIGYGFSSPGHVRGLLLSLTAMALALGVALTLIALRHTGNQTTEWIAALASPILVVPNDVALLAVLLPAYLLPLRLRPRSVAAVLGALAAAVTLLACVALQSRTGLLTALVSLTALAILWRSRPLLIVTLTTPLVALVVDQMLLGGHLTAKFASFWDTRFALWVTAWQMFVDAPLVGNGPNTFGALYPQYIAALDTGGLLPVDGRVVPWPHNLYLEMLAERGFVGLCALLFVIGAAARIGWRLRNCADTEIRLLATAMLACLVGVAFSGFLELTLLRLWVVVLTFVLLGILQYLSRHAALRGLQARP